MCSIPDHIEYKSEGGILKKTSLLLVLGAILTVASFGIAWGAVSSSAQARQAGQRDHSSVRTSSKAKSQIRHVFVITLENKGYKETFGPGSPAPYLSKKLTTRGELLTNYYGIGHESLDNYIAMVSGQAPNSETQGDCQIYSNFEPQANIGPNGQAIGQGCVYPAQVKTVADQLDAKGLSWKGYMQDMGNDPTRESATCGHPKLNTQDNTQRAEKGDQYATRHNPFVYFHSVIDSPKCQRNDVALSQLPKALRSAKTTPNFSFITPNLCSDGHDSPCVDGRPGGLKSADEFLKAWVPRILKSPAYKKDGLLVINFDESDGPQSDSRACCGEKPGPNSPSPGITGPGGGRTGAVLLSPFIKPGSVNDTPYNHYALLRSIEDIYGLKHLGYAGQAGLKAFGSDVYNHNK